MAYLGLPAKDSSFLRRDNSSAPNQDNVHDLGTTSLKWANIHATTFNGTATTAQYADIAERYAVDNKVEPGDIVKLGGEAEVTKTTEYGDTEVFGVVSTDPAYMMNSEAGNDETHPYIALTGRVPCKVINKVKKGDRIVSSTFPGVGIAADLADINPWQVVGRALEDNDDEVFRLIEIVVGKN